jgi:hypothetical protein
MIDFSLIVSHDLFWLKFQSIDAPQASNLSDGVKLVI